jgi:hypothetical protein
MYSSVEGILTIIAPTAAISAEHMLSLYGYFDKAIQQKRALQNRM